MKTVLELVGVRVESRERKLEEEELVAKGNVFGEGLEGAVFRKLLCVNG